MSVDFTLGTDNINEMAFVSFSTFYDLQPFFAAFKVPHICVHNRI